MCAFVVGEDHIHAMLALALAGNPGCPMRWHGRSGTIIHGAKGGEEPICRMDHLVADQVGRMLVAENERSVAHRYGEEPAGEAEGYTLPILVTRRMPTATEGLKLLACYEYQSCETPDWEQSEAYRFCQVLRKELIAQLPVYDDAPWEWTDEHARAA